MTLHDHLRVLHDAQVKYNESADSLSKEQVQEARVTFQQMRQDIITLITEGAEPCPDCGNMPIAAYHDGTPTPFEIGCGHCWGHRVRGSVREVVVEEWNAGRYLESQVVMRKLDATGKVLEERVVTPQ